MSPGSLSCWNSRMPCAAAVSLSRHLLPGRFFWKIQEKRSTFAAKIVKLPPKIMLSQGGSALTPLRKRYLLCSSSPLYAGWKESRSPKLPALEIKQGDFILNWSLSLNRMAQTVPSARVLMRGYGFVWETTQFPFRKKGERLTQQVCNSRWTSASARFLAGGSERWASSQGSQERPVTKDNRAVGLRFTRYNLRTTPGL